MTMAAEDAALRADVLGAAVLRGQFTLRSGKTSSYYVDKYRFQVRPFQIQNPSTLRQV